MRVVVFFGFIAVVALALWLASGYFEGQAWLYVDNGDGRPVSASIDGAEPVTVSAGAYEILKCKPGQRRITIVAEGKVLFDETKDVEAISRSVPGKYLLNPRKSNRYAAWTQKYSLFGGAPHTVYGDKLAFYQTDFSELAKQAEEIQALPAEIWLECSFYDDVLCAPPPNVERKDKAQKDTRHVLSRISKRDYGVFLSGAPLPPPTPKIGAVQWEWEPEWAKATAELRAAIKRLRHSKDFDVP